MAWLPKSAPMKHRIRTGLKGANFRPLLDKLPAIPRDLFQPGTLVFTMSIGQWDNLLAAAYQHGATLLELDDAERPVAAYRKKDSVRSE